MTSHYAHPELYAAHLDPDAEEWAWLDALIDAARAPALGGADRVGAVLDPACGPGSYLARWVETGCAVTGIDLEPAMVAFAEARLGAIAETAAQPAGAIEVRVGDMRDPKLPDAAFDLALNLNASLGHLPDDDAVAAHLRATRAALVQGAGYLLGVTVLAPGDDDDEAIELHEPNFVPLDDGRWGSLTYVSARREPSARREWIEVTLAIGPMGAPEERVERYPLHTHTATSISALAEAAGFAVVGWADASDGERIDADALDGALDGDAIVLLRAI